LFPIHGADDEIGIAIEIAGRSGDVPAEMALFAIRGVVENGGRSVRNAG